MAKLTVVVLVITLVGLAHCSDPFAAIRDKVASHFQLRETKETRQSCDFPSDYPQECVTASDNVLNVVTAAPDLASIDLATLNTYFAELCTMECIGPLVQVYDCLGESDFAEFFNNGYCGQSNGEYCMSLWIKGVNSNSIESISFCGLDGSCDPSCQNSLQVTDEYLGCCAASLYNNTFSPFSILITPDQFATCNVTLGEQCAGVVTDAGDAGVVNRVGLGLLTIFAMVAALVNALLF